MTFLEAIAETNDQGWYLYALHQTSHEERLLFPDRPAWTCTLRASSGPPRREISHGSGDDPIAAICNALGSAPELEGEVSTCDLPAADPERAPRVDLLASLRQKYEPVAFKRRRLE